MSEALVVILLLLWALVLLPGAVRSWRSSPSATVGGFHRAMEVLRHRPAGGGRYVMVPRDAGRVTRSASPDRALLYRRRRAFAALALGTLATGLLAALLGGPFWPLFAVVASVLALYVWLLRRWKHQRRDAAEVVRLLPATRPRRPSHATASHLDGSGGTAAGREVVGAGSATGGGQGRWAAQSAVRVRRWSG